MGDRQPSARYSIRRWVDVPYLHIYVFADDVFDLMYTKFEALFEVYEEQYERTLVENQTICYEILEPLKDYFFKAKTVCAFVLNELHKARMLIREERRVCRRAMTNVYDGINSTYKHAIHAIYELGKQKLYAAFIDIESHCWRFGFGDATEQWVEFVNAEA